MDAQKLKEIIDSHGKWLRGDKGGERADLRRADLHEADLRRADLRGADLRRANLCRADLRRADLREADLCEADLCGADLCRANLRRANLRRANLHEADLCEADLCGADLCEADLPTRIIQVGPIGSRKSYTIYRVDEDIVQCGCWNNYKGGTLNEFKARIDEVYPDGQYRDEYLAAIAMFETMKERKSDR